MVQVEGLHRASLSYETLICGGKRIKSVVLHITRLLPGVSGVVQGQLQAGSVLFMGPICSGKTTMLRDVAAYFSLTHQVAVADFTGEFQGAIGALCVAHQPGQDPLQLLSLLLCQHSPEIIIAEFGSLAYVVAAAKMCADSGVRLLCSARGSLDGLIDFFLQASFESHVPACSSFPLDAVVVLRREMDYYQLYPNAKATACSMVQGWRPWCEQHQATQSKDLWVFWGPKQTLHHERSLAPRA